MSAIFLKVERGNSGAYFITSPQVDGLLVSKMSLGDALADTARALQELAELRGLDRPPYQIPALPAESPDNEGWQATKLLEEKDAELSAIRAENERLREAVKGVLAWKDVVEMVMPELGGLTTAMYRADAALKKTDNG
jgi:hypothetical protein